VISDFSHEVDENCSLLGYYAAIIGSSLPTLRDNLSVSFSGVKKKEIITNQKSAVLINSINF
jgi:hypothetical protein